MKNKRFIAGAQCPSCKEFDKIYTYEAEEKKFRACVRCEFEEQLHLSVPPTEIGTRVNRSVGERKEEVRTVRLMDPKA